MKMKMKINIAVQQLAKALIEQRRFIACAESCTGGLVAAAMTALSGSSQWFERGYVTYSNAAKEQDLQVSAETLQQFGAVSEQTALAMASGVLYRCPTAQIALATTGIAGPTGATADKPLGMVCFAVAHREAAGIVAQAQTEIFSGSRQDVRAAATLFALDYALQHLKAHVPR